MKYVYTNYGCNIQTFTATTMPIFLTANKSLPKHLLDSNLHCLFKKLLLLTIKASTPWIILQLMLFKIQSGT